MRRPPAVRCRQRRTQQRDRQEGGERAAASPMKRSCGKDFCSASETRPWIAKSAAETGVESPSFRREMPFCISPADMVLSSELDAVSCAAQWAFARSVRWRFDILREMD